jgi:hypothetical protein
MNQALYAHTNNKRKKKFIDEKKKVFLANILSVLPLKGSGEEDSLPHLHT